MLPRLIGMLTLSLLVASCGGGEGPKLGDFPDVVKKETDEAFTLTAPSSKSPAAFSFTSSNASVATISGNMVTIVGPGQSVITASQSSVGSFGPTSASMVLTVNAVACDAGKTRINKVCVTIPTCVAPATLQNNICIAPPQAGNFVSQNGRTWSPASFADIWSDASAYCKGTTINGVANWRLPSEAELSDLFASGLLTAQNWSLGKTWSSSVVSVNGSVVADSHRAIDLRNGGATSDYDGDGAFVVCVR